MATPIKIPDIGTTVEQVTLIDWLKQEGDSVRRGEAICVVETDKAASELESVAEGVLLKQVVPAGSEIEVGTVIAYVGEAGESVPDRQTAAPSEKQAQPEQPASDRQQESGEPGISPLIRNLAGKEGVDLAAVTGSGPGGKITRQDILRAREAADESGVPLAREQLAVARRVLQSIREIPAIDLTCDLEMTRAIEKRQQVIREQSQKITYDAVFVFAISRIIKDFPRFASHVSGQKVISHEGVDVALAVGVDERLYTPVIRDADKLPLLEIDRKIRSLCEKAGKGELRPSDMAGGSITVSNLGMFPVRSFKMIIPPDQSAAVSIGTMEERPVVKGGEVVCVPIVTIVLSVDHRLINGREAAEFLRQLKEFVETL